MKYLDLTKYYDFNLRFNTLRQIFCPRIILLIIHSYVYVSYKSSLYIHFIKMFDVNRLAKVDFVDTVYMGYFQSEERCFLNC